MSQSAVDVSTCRGHGSNPGKPDFFRLSFRNCISCVNNCKDLLYIYLSFDYWLISDGLQDIIEHTDIIPSIKSDHSAITLQINSIEDQVRGPSHWCFNSSLLNDENYFELITVTAKYGEWIQDFADVQDKRLLWDLIKYKIKQFTISYKAKERRNGFQDVENKFKEKEKLCAENPTEENIEALEELKIEYNSLYDYFTQGNIIRSRANWYGKGEKIINIF